jgi:hypothetical protein
MSAERFIVPVHSTAILGWGSLLWRQGSLQNNSDWKPDGPWLPIEFARKSGLHKGQPYLSLVLRTGVDLIRVYWDVSLCEDLTSAAENLRQREACSQSDIGYVTKAGQHSPNSPPGVQPRIAEWLNSKQNLDMVIWTDLPGDLDVEAGIEWLERLRSAGQAQYAEEYVRKAPSQTDTLLRRQVREKFGWTDIPIGY